MAWIRSLARLAIVAGALQPSLASFWTVTELMVYEPTVLPYRCDEAGITEVKCTTAYDYPFTVKHTTIPTGVTPLSSTILSNDSWDVKIVSIYLPGGAVPRSELINYDESTSSPTPTSLSIPASWVVDITFTAAASCPTPFEYTAHASLGWGGRLPSELAPFLLPKATVVEATRTYTRTIVTPLYATPATTLTQTLPATYTTFHVQPTDVPPVQRPNMTYFGFINRSYMQECYNPHEKGEAAKEAASEAAACPYTYGGVCSKTPPWVIVAIVLPSIFLLGFAENFFWFRRLMLGKGCLRFGTVCWWLMGLFIAFFTTYKDKRSAQDQKRLKEQWKTIPFRMKMKLWFKWGFRHQYPVAWLGKRNTVRDENSVEMGRAGGGAGGAAGNNRRGGQGGEDEMPLPAYPGPPPSLGASDSHSVDSGTTVATPGLIVGNPNAVLGQTGSGTVVIGPTQTPASTQRPNADQGPTGDGFRAV